LSHAVVVEIAAHEVAHAATAGNDDESHHSDEWRACFRDLMRVATEDLGWPVALECSACPFYHICSPEDCPKCSWVPCHSRRPAV
jgi:rubrerythrin